jgi:hypothetical protein
MDYDVLIAQLQAQIRGYNSTALQAGPQQTLASGATVALLQIAIQLAELNKNLVAFTAAVGPKG